MFLQPPTNAHLYQTTNSIVWFDKNGICYSAPNDKPYKKLSREETIEEIKNIKAFSGGKKLFSITEPHPGLQSIEKEDRDFVAEQLAGIMGAMAIVTTSKFHVLVVKIFFLFKPAPYPQNIFSDVDTAKDWLLEIMNKGNNGKKALMVA